jgi:excisionase family DNA binding protein
MADDLLEDFANRVARRILAGLAERTPQPPLAAAPPTRSEYLTTKQAAALLGLGRSTLENWRAVGKGPRFTKLPGPAGPVRYSREDLEEWLARHSR